jgi:hypothetical protein
MTNIELKAARLNELYFLPEFTFANATFSPPTGTERELADGIVWLEDSALIFQMKERSAAVSEAENCDRWLERKVLTKATQQMRATLDYLGTHPEISAKNGRGQSVTLRGDDLQNLHKIVLYLEPEQTSTRKKFHVSSTAGFIHVIPEIDYRGIVETLCTLSELFEYLDWREHLLRSYSSAQSLPELSLVGNFLWGNRGKAPELSDAGYLYALQDNQGEWDVSGILQNFLARSTEENENNNYHSIIGQIPKLNRAELKCFKDRFLLSIKKAREDSFTLPYRFSSVSTRCGFVFIPLENEYRSSRRIALVNFAQALKYDERLDRCVGITFLADPDGWFTIDWGFVSFPWQYDRSQQEQLESFYPFRKANAKRVSRYEFSPDIMESFGSDKIEPGEEEH